MAETPETTQQAVKILVIEDSPTQLEELRFLLEESGFAVVAATNGREGLAAVKASAVDLVISDIVMPEMDGFALCKALRADETLRDLPVILLTSLADPRDVIRGLESGANNFICKPYDHPALLARVRNVLANQELRKTAPSEMGISIFFAGQRFFITADRLQILDLLLSTYENAVNANSELIRVRDELQVLNEQLEARVAERTAALAERAKEVNCLYAISSLVATSRGPLNESLKDAVALIPPGWQHPEIIRARIVFEGQEFPSADFRDTPWKQSAGIVISGETVGTVDVCYLEQRPVLDEGPFLKEERDLIVDIARQLGVMIEHRRAEAQVEALARFPEENRSPVLRIGSDGTLLYANSSADPLTQLWGCEPGQSVPAEWVTLIADAVTTGKRKRVEVDCGGRSYTFDICPIPAAGYANAYGHDVTERKRAEEALSVSEARYRRLFEAAKDGILILDAETGMVVDVNPFLMQMLGYSHEQLLGKAIWDLGFLRDVIANQDKFQELRRREYVRYEHLPLSAADGRLIDVEFVSNVYLVGHTRVIQCNIRDITERTRADRELQESRQLVDSIVENVPLMLFLKEAQDLRFVVFNRAGEELLGYDRKELLGKNNLDLFPPEQAAFFMAKDREVLAGGVPLDIPEEPIQTAKRGERLLHTRKVCIKGADGVTRYLLGISEDVTERKQAEVKIERQLEELQRWQDVMLGREDRVQELKREVNDLCRRVGEPVRYGSQEAGPAVSEGTEPR